MKKNYAVRNVEKLLRGLDASRHSLAYLNSIRGTSLSLREEEALKKRVSYLTRTIKAAEHSLAFLDPLERKIVEDLYFRPDSSIDRLCEQCALEKSSVYRYRARALQKLAAALYGGG